MRVAAALLFALTVQSGPRWEPQRSGTTAEVRGLHALARGMVWAGARGGVFARTVDGGATWTAASVPDAASLFFIDVHAASEHTAWLLGTAFEGNEGRIYRTDDGGSSWRLQYARAAPGMFLDGLAFWDPSRGVAFGDPVEGSFLILVTDDGGSTWEEITAAPAPLAGEAGFAASGTALVTHGERDAWFGTGGGDHARVFRTDDGGRHWTATSTPLPASGSAGIFGLAFRDARHGVAVGGDYREPRGPAPNLLRTEDGGASWTLVRAPGLMGVQYGVVHVHETTFLAVGPTGSSLSIDDGRTWSRIDSTGYNTVAAGGSLGAVWAAGRDGQIARLRAGR